MKVQFSSGSIQRIAILMQCVFTSLFTAAQNLIPNPGFEDIFTQSEFQWVQPQGAYYHYERADSNAHAPARTGIYLNGLCMYPDEPNEYLHIKLLKPLKAGSTYRIETHARLMRIKSHNAQKHSMIGVYFGYKRLDTHLPGDFSLQPQATFRLPKGNRFEWFHVADTFVAKGGEQYITIGYFPETQRTEYISRKQDAFMENIEFRNQASKAQSTEDKSWLYLPPDEQKKYLKQLEKDNRKKGATGRQNTAPEPIDTLRRPPKPKDSATDITSILDLSPHFSVRYYFDDFCLTEIREGVDAKCSSETIDEVIEVGRSINLQNVFFETDKDELLDESVLQLNALKSLLQKYQGMRIEIQGYTDNRGSEAYNKDLSNRRARSVVRWLTTEGTEASRLTYRGYGPANPVATNDTDAGRALNRRVVFLILEI